MELTNKATLRDLVKNNEINLSQKVFMKLSEQIESVVVQYGLSTLSKTSQLKILEFFFSIVLFPMWEGFFVTQHSEISININRLYSMYIRVHLRLDLDIVY